MFILNASYSFSLLIFFSIVHKFTIHGVASVCSQKERVWEKLEYRRGMYKLLWYLNRDAYCRVHERDLSWCDYSKFNGWILKKLL